jgi:DNA-binding NtrC family response regulator
MPEAWRAAARSGENPGEAQEPDGALVDRLETLAELEARHIRKVLAFTGGRIEAAAKILGIHRNTLARKIREYGL